MTMNKRELLSLGLGAAAAGLAPSLALAQTKKAAVAEDIVLGASMPMTGVFAFAGIAVDKGIKDYMTILNGAGGIQGRKVKYIAEDTAYKVDQSMATFKKLTSQNKINLYYGDSTGFHKAVNPELDRNGNILMTGASFAKEISNADKYQNQFMVGPDYSEMVGILLKYISSTKPGAKVALVYSDTEFGRDPVDAFRTDTKKLGLSVAVEIVTPPGSVDVSAEVVKLPRRPRLHHLPWLRVGPHSRIHQPGQEPGHEVAVHGHLLEHGQDHGDAHGPGGRWLLGRHALPLLRR